MTEGVDASPLADQLAERLEAALLRAADTIAERVAERVLAALTDAGALQRLALADLTLARSSLGQIDRLLANALRSALDDDPDWPNGSRR